MFQSFPCLLKFFYCTLLGGTVVLFSYSRLWSTFSGSVFFFQSPECTTNHPAKKCTPYSDYDGTLKHSTPYTPYITWENHHPGPSFDHCLSRWWFFWIPDSDVFLIDQSNISKLESILGVCLLLLLMVQKCGLPIDVGSFIRFLGFWDGCFRFWTINSYLLSLCF